MLRECVRYEALAKILLHSEQFYDFFKYVDVSTTSYSFTGAFSSGGSGRADSIKDC